MAARLLPRKENWLVDHDSWKLGIFLDFSKAAFIQLSRRSQGLGLAPEKAIGEPEWMARDDISATLRLIGQQNNLLPNRKAQTFVVWRRTDVAVMLGPTFLFRLAVKLGPHHWALVISTVVCAYVTIGV